MFVSSYLYTKKLLTYINNFVKAHSFDKSIIELISRKIEIDKCLIVIINDITVVNYNSYESIRVRNIETR